MVYIVNVKDNSILKNFSHLKWGYIGSYGGLFRAKRILADSKRIYLAKYIENITNSVRGNFVDYLGKLSQQQKDKILWYSTRMASKSSSQTSMFHQYVYMKLVEMFIRQNKDVLVVSDEKEFFYNINKIFSNRVKIVGKKVSDLKQVYKSRRWYLRIGRYFIFSIFCKFLKKNQPHDFDVFINSWIDERAFQKLPYYTDSYFGDLEDILKKKGYHVGRITSLRVSLKNIIKTHKYFNNVFYLLTYISFKDFIKAFFKKVRVTIIDEDFNSIKDYEMLAVLLDNEIYKENKTKIFIDYLLHFYAYKKISLLFRERTAFIYPFENQPWEKMVNLAFVNSNMIAYQHSTICENWLEHRVSKYEDNMPLPKVILTVGKKWTFFLKEFYKNLIIEEAGSLRFPYLFNETNKKNMSGSIKNIVVALPSRPELSMSLQNCLLSFLKTDGLENYSIKIKPHPYLQKSPCFKKQFFGYQNCKFVKNNIGDLLKDCHLLITTNSTVVFESVFSGIKTLYLIPEEPSWGLEFFIKDSLFIAYEDNFSEILEKALKSSAYPSLDISEYFSQPDYGTFLKYLDQKNMAEVL